MKKKVGKRYLFMILGILMVMFIVTRGFSYARYASNEVFNYYLSSKGFYFESDDLSYDTKKNVDTMWDGEKIYFSVSNGTNDVLASEVDITYEVSCVVDELDTTKKCLLNGTNSSEIKATLSASYGCKNDTDDGIDVGSYDESRCVSAGYVWGAKISSSDLYFEVVDEENEVLNAKVLITVTSTKPYKKELSASYNLIKDNSQIGSLSMKYEEKSLNSRLIVTNSYNEDKCVRVSWNSTDFIFDNNSFDVLGYETDVDGNINDIYFKIGKMDSVSLNYFKKDAAITYNELYFSLVESNVCQ